MGPGHGRPLGLGPERLIGRLLILVTDLSVVLLVVGVGLLLGAGISPLAGGPGLDPGALVANVGAREPAGFLWLGLLVVIAAPISRVVVAGMAYARAGDRLMVGVALAILTIIAIGITTAGTAGV